jgi:hypothetical protein
LLNETVDLEEYLFLSAKKLGNAQPVASDLSFEKMIY